MNNIVDDILGLLKNTKKYKPQNVLDNFDDYFSNAVSELSKEGSAEMITDGESILNQVKNKYYKDLKGFSFWDKKRNQQLVYNSPDNIHGGHNFYTREGTIHNVSKYDVKDLSLYSGKNKLDYNLLENYNKAMTDFEHIDDRLKYKDPDKYYTDVKNKIEQIDAYEKKIGQGYKNYKGNQNYHKRRSWIADDVNKHFGEEVLSMDPLKKEISKNTTNTRTNTRTDTPKVNNNVGNASQTVDDSIRKLDKITELKNPEKRMWINRDFVFGKDFTDNEAFRNKVIDFYSQGDRAEELFKNLASFEDYTPSQQYLNMYGNVFDTYKNVLGLDSEGVKQKIVNQLEDWKMTPTEMKGHIDLLKEGAEFSNWQGRRDFIDYNSSLWTKDVPNTTTENITKNVTKENVQNISTNPQFLEEQQIINRTLDDISNKPIDSMSTGTSRYIKKQQTEAWKKDLMNPKSTSWSYYDNMQSTIKGIHEYARTVPKPNFPLSNNATPEEIQRAIEQYNRWNTAQYNSRSLKFLGRDLKQNQERFERAQANIDETIKRQRKMEEVEKEYQEWKQKQQIDKDHAEAIEMNKQYNMQDEAYKMNEMYDAHTEAIEMNRQYDIDRQQNPNRVYDVNKAWDEAIDEDVAREMARQQQLEKELPDIFKNNSNNQNVIPNKDDVINVGPDDFEIINPGDAPEEIVGGNLEIINNNNMNSNNTPPNTPKDRAPKMDNPPKNEVVVYNQNTKVGNSRLNVDDVDDNIIEGTFRVLDDADDAAKIKMPGKASMLGTAGAVIGAISDYKDARRKGHGVISSGLRAAGSFVLGEMIGWKGQLALMAVKALPSAAIKGTSMLYQENRRMNSAANQGVFGSAQFQDTQQLATMRQSGMEMAKMSQYNLQQTLMGNEATYLHR